MSIYTYSSCFLLLSLVVGCGNASRADFDTNLLACPQKPTPIFRAGMKGVSATTFTLEPTKSIETVAFSDSTNLEIIQMGCAHVHQEFRFELAEPLPLDDAAAVGELAAQKFTAIAQLDSRLAGLGGWAGMLREAKTQLKIGEAIALEPHHFLKVDGFAQNKNSLLIVSIYEE